MEGKRENYHLTQYVTQTNLLSAGNLMSTAPNFMKQIYYTSPLPFVVVVVSSV